MNYRELLKDKKRIVVKVGSSSLIHKETGKLDLRKVEVLVRELSDLRGSAPAPAQESAHVSSAAPYSRNAVAGGMTLSRDEIAAITRAVLERLER